MLSMLWFFLIFKINGGCHFEKRSLYEFEQCFSVVADKSSLWPAPTAVQSIYKEICLGYIEQIIYPLPTFLSNISDMII